MWIKVFIAKKKKQTRAVTSCTTACFKEVFPFFGRIVKERRTFHSDGKKIRKKYVGELGYQRKKNFVSKRKKRKIYKEKNF